MLRELEGAGGEGDVVIGGEQGDQGNHEASNGLDPTLEIEAAAPAGGLGGSAKSGADSGVGSIRTKPRGHQLPSIVHTYDPVMSHLAGKAGLDAGVSGRLKTS